MKWMLSLIIAACLLIILVAFESKTSGKSEFETAREVIVMRKIAHKVLQYTGDSTSRILPVNQLSKNEFQIPFQSSFSFKPDSLVSIIDKIIQSNGLPSDYIVNVLECNTDKVVYGYSVLRSQPNDVVPCLGREQPEMRYCINIRFQENESFNVKNIYKAGIGLLGLGFLIFGVYQYKKKKNIITPEEEEVITQNHSIPVGKFRFYPHEQFLLLDKEKTILTIKEAKLLSIFAASPNVMVDRNRLQKEVWEDEGVIVGRSLDVFISRLRKKLESDPDVKLTNIHGKGYKLEINSDSV